MNILETFIEPFVFPCQVAIAFAAGASVPLLTVWVLFRFLP